MISPVAGFPRYALNDERVGHPHPIVISVPGDCHGTVCLAMTQG